MVLIEWRQEYCTGFSGVDYEHEQLINQINAVYGLARQKLSKQAVIEGLGDIYASISAHFALEEQTMQKLEYDCYDEHRADHERLLDEIREITEDYEEKIEFDELQFKQKLADWFQFHFKTHDSRLHSLADQDSQERPVKGPMKSLIDQAKNAFQGRKRQ
jgi:hemerythrin